MFSTDMKRMIGNISGRLVYGGGGGNRCDQFNKYDWNEKLMTLKTFIVSPLVLNFDIFYTTKDLFHHQVDNGFIPVGKNSMIAYAKYSDYVHFPAHDMLGDFVKFYLAPVHWAALPEERQIGWKSLHIPTSKDEIKFINSIQMKLKPYVDLVVSIRLY